MADLGGLMKQSKELINSAYDKGYKQGLAESKVEVKDADHIWYKENQYISLKRFYEAKKESFQDGYEKGMLGEERKEQSELLNEIKVGDEVCLKSRVSELDNCDIGICTYINHKNRTIYVMRMDGSCDEQPMNEWRKTGRHFDIDKILEQMKEVDK